MKRGPTPTKTETFSEYFDRQGFKHFKARELTWMFSRVNKGVRNSEPPRALWSSIVPTIHVLDALRARLGVSITLTSTYRSKAYNRSVGSGDGSQHPKFTAVDFKANGITPAMVAKTLRQMRARGEFTGGVGLYKTFVHLDTRASNADW